MKEGVSRELARYWWLRGVACSEASLTTQMRGFGFKKPVYEQATHTFSGGFMHQGYASGLLTGAVFAAGFVANERFQNNKTKSGAALHAAIQLAKTFPEYSGSINCQEITKINLTGLGGRLNYLKTGTARMCGRLHLKWAPKAYQLIDKSLTEYGKLESAKSYANCSVQTMEALKSKLSLEEDSSLMAGFAGGVGLCGNLCGALAVGTYIMAISQQFALKKKKRDSRIRGMFEELFGTNYKGYLTQFRHEFVQKFGSELCIDIAGHLFQNARDHSKFLEKGGCNNIINFITDWVINSSAINTKDA